MYRNEPTMNESNNCSARSDRAQRWRQSYRNSQPNTIGTYAGLSEVNPKSISTHSGEQRKTRQLPEEPYTSKQECFRRFDHPNSSTQSHHLSPPFPRLTERTISFDGRLVPNSEIDNYSYTTSPPQLPYENDHHTKSEKVSSVNSRNQSLVRSEIELAKKRERLGVTPSIEIIRVQENSDSSTSLDGDVGRQISRESATDPKSFVKLPVRQLSAQSLLDSPMRSHNYPQRQSPSIVQTKASVKPVTQDSVESVEEDRNRNRRRLTRQPKSFQGDPHLSSPKRVQPSDVLLDEFDYFCRIANAPVGPMTDQSLKPNRHVQATRSHSMRTANTNDSGNRPENLSGVEEPRMTYKTKHLMPPVRGQLRRASTEEDRLKKTLLEKRPVTATLSYTAINSSMQNLCKTPPKTVPTVPTIPIDFYDPSLPLGVPLSEESIIADEPGMTFYQVQVLGSSAVGKTSLCQRLVRLTSNMSSNYDFEEDEETKKSYSVTAAFNGSVYTVNFVDSSAESFEKNLEIKVHDCVDAFLIVYAVDDLASYEAARLIINALAPSQDPEQSPSLVSKTSTSQIQVPTPIHVVANKTDLVRGRQVSTDDGRHLASLHDAKFIEVSASLNHMIAELFVQLISNLTEAELKYRDPRLPPERRVRQSQLSPHHLVIRSNSSVGKPFRIPASTKSSFSKFLKRHFTRASEESE